MFKECRDKKAQGREMDCLIWGIVAVGRGGSHAFQHTPSQHSANAQLMNILLFTLTLSSCMHTSWDLASRLLLFLIFTRFHPASSWVEGQNGIEEEEIGDGAGMVISPAEVGLCFLTLFPRKAGSSKEMFFSLLPFLCLSLLNPFLFFSRSTHPLGPNLKLEGGGQH